MSPYWGRKLGLEYDQTPGDRNTGAGVRTPAPPTLRRASIDAGERAVERLFAPHAKRALRPEVLVVSAILRLFKLWATANRALSAASDGGH